MEKYKMNAVVAYNKIFETRVLTLPDFSCFHQKMRSIHDAPKNKTRQQKLWHWSEKTWKLLEFFPLLSNGSLEKISPHLRYLAPIGIHSHSPDQCDFDVEEDFRIARAKQKLQYFCHGEKNLWPIEGISSFDLNVRKTNSNFQDWWKRKGTLISFH